MLRLVFERRGGRTILTERRFRLPLQALTPLDLDGGPAVVMMLNPTGGLLAGDVLDTALRLGAGSHVCVSAPSATRVYRSGGVAAVQRFAATLAPGATLEYVPDRLIASRGARLCQSTEIALGPDATLFLAETWATGRVARGEAWNFDLLDSALAVRDARGFLLKERSILEHSGWAGPGSTEGLGYVGTCVAIRTGDGSWPELAATLARAVERHGRECRGGVTLLARGGVLVRLLCRSAPVLDEVVGRIWALCRGFLLGRGPIELRKL